MEDAVAAAASGVFGCFVSILASSMAVDWVIGYYESISTAQTRSVGFSPHDIGDAAQAVLDRFQNIVLIGLIAGLGVVRLETAVTLTQVLNLTLLLLSGGYFYRLIKSRAPREYVSWAEIRFGRKPSAVDPTTQRHISVSKLDLLTGLVVGVQVALALVHMP